jgi:hypothetical protein
MCGFYYVLCLGINYTALRASMDLSDERHLKSFNVQSHANHVASFERVVRMPSRPIVELCQAHTILYSLQSTVRFLSTMPVRLHRRGNQSLWSLNQPSLVYISRTLGNAIRSSARP